MTDYAWNASPTLTSGKHIPKIENAAVQSHEMIIAQLPEPGAYKFLCFLPDAKDGKPHVAHGMLSQVTVR